MHQMNAIRALTRAARISTLAGFLALTAPVLQATTLLGMDIDEVARDAELVFEGEVILRESRRDNGTGNISTHVTFAVMDVIAGDYSGDSLELKFLGGVFEGRIMEVSGNRIPQIGEHGIYFVESTSRDLINPLLGWSQGHFLIYDDAGTSRMATATEAPVIDIQSTRGLAAAIKKPQTLVDGSGDPANGVVTSENSRNALTVPDFKSRIRRIIEN